MAQGGGGGGSNSNNMTRRSGIFKPGGSPCKEESLSPSPGEGASGGGGMGSILSPKALDGFDYMKNRIDTLEADLARRQESYIRRERAYKTR